jgi:hypothetical protein
MRWAPLLYLSFTIMTQMQQMEQDYRITTEKEAINYILSHGLKLHEFSQLSIKGNQGLIYLLPNGEAVLTPSGPGYLKENHPSFIYKNIEAFQKMKESGYYPIPDSAKTFLELEYPYLKDFVANMGHYKILIEKYASLDKNINDLQLTDLEYIYTPIHKVWLSKKISNIESQRTVLGYSMLLMFVLMKNTNGSINLKSEYEIYNEIYYPELVINGVMTDVLSDVISAMQINVLKDSKEHFFSTLKYKIDLAVKGKKPYGF